MNYVKLIKKPKAFYFSQRKKITRFTIRDYFLQYFSIDLLTPSKIVNYLKLQLCQLISYNTTLQNRPKLHYEYALSKNQTLCL